MAADLNLLDAGFRGSVLATLDRCRARGVVMRPYFALRTPFEQAKLWRQSRAIEEIRAQITSWRNAGANFLVHCLESVGPQHGEHVTNAPPGFSWHQWGEAVDCFWLVNAKAEWSTVKKIGGLNGYHVYAEEGERSGLNAGGHWKKLKDWPHLQKSAAGSPAGALTLLQIDAAMRQRFGG